MTDYATVPSGSLYIRWTCWSKRPTTVPAGSDHYFHTCCPSIRPASPKLQNPATITTGRDCGLAKWIIDDSCLVGIYSYPPSIKKIAKYFTTDSFSRFFTSLKFQKLIQGIWTLVCPFHYWMKCTDIEFPEPQAELSIYSLVVLKIVFDPPGPGRISGHYFHTGCPSVRPSQKTKTCYSLKTKYVTTLDGAWWVTLKYPDLFSILLTEFSLS